ncbi:MAG: hypothetical protein ACXAC5_03425 [Promethearchaeota archaeon]|jgi:hypothetical protein
MNWLIRTAQRQVELPNDLSDDLSLLDEEREWYRTVSTPGSFVRHDKEGWTGKVIKLYGDPVNNGRILVDHDGLQRWYSPLDFSPMLKLVSRALLD